jgi:hypothetical protein
MAHTVHSVVNSYNLFVDTARGRNPQSTGDDTTISLNDSQVVAGIGQYIRLNLIDFSMYNDLWGVDANNNKLRVSDSTTNVTAVIAPGNYTALSELAAAFAEACRAAAQTLAGGTVTIGAGSVVPASATGYNNGLLGFQLSFSTAVPAGFTISCPSFLGDAYALLGANRDSTPGFQITVGATRAGVLGLYPAQLTTLSNIYLRTDLPSTNIQTQSLGSPAPNIGAAQPSTILARIPVSNNKIRYFAQTGREFFMNLSQKTLSGMRLYLTDESNRPLGRDFLSLGSTSQTAAGIGRAQSTLGNLAFNCTLRIDIVQGRQVNELNTPLPKQSVPGRFSTILNHQDFGRSNYPTILDER